MDQHYDKRNVYLIESLCQTLSMSLRDLDSSSSRRRSSEYSQRTADRLINLSRTIMDLIAEDDCRSLPMTKTDGIIVEHLLPIYKLPTITENEKHKLDIILFHFWWRKLIFNRITDNNIWNREVVLKRSSISSNSTTTTKEEATVDDDTKENNNSPFHLYQRHHKLDDQFWEQKKRRSSINRKKDANVISCMSSLSPMTCYFENFENELEL